MSCVQQNAVNDVNVVVDCTNFLARTVAAAAVAGGVHFLFVNDRFGHRRKYYLWWTCYNRSG